MNHITTPHSYILLILSCIFCFNHAQAIEFDLHNHSQNHSTFDELTLNKGGVTVVISANDDLVKTGHGIGVEDNEHSELDYKSAEEDVMSFKFFDAQKQPLNILLKTITLKKFEPNVAQDLAQIQQLDGRFLANLDSALRFNGTAGFISDRHDSNTWSLKKDVDVATGFTINPTKGSGFYVYSLDIEILDMPVIITLPTVTAVAEGAVYHYPLKYTDEDPTSVVFSLLQAPKGMILDESHTLHWEPNFDAQGQYPVVVLATDKKGQQSQLTFTLNVSNTNQLPLFTSIPPLTSKESQLYQYTLAAFDKDKEPVFYQILQGPEAMVLNEESHTLSWTPSFKDAGEHLITVAAQDAFDMRIQQFTINVQDLNRTPTIQPIPSQTSSENDYFEYAIKAQDSDQDVLTFKLINAPLNMQLNSVTGVINWPVGFNQSGPHHIQVQVGDGKQGFAVSDFNIDVKNINLLPKILGLDVVNAKENFPYVYHVLVEDLDFDGVSITLDDGPSGMSINHQSNTLHWQPSFDSAGIHEVELSLDDGIDVTEHRFNITVMETNRPPMFDHLNAVSGSEGQLFKQQVRASDLDDDPLSYELLWAPKGMSIHAKSGQLHWQPTFNQAGIYDVQVKVSDQQGASDTRTVVVNIAQVNRVPVIETKSLINALQGQEYFFQLRAHDPDHDKLKYTLLNGPAGMSLHADKGYIVWKSQFTDEAEYTVKVSVSDGVAEHEAVWELTVKDVNRDPLFLSKPLLLSVEGQTYMSQLQASDPDGDDIHYSLITAPTGMYINHKHQLVWKPNFNQAGFYPVTLVAADNREGIVQQSFTLQVNNQNRRPTFISEPVLSITEGQHFLYSLQAIDPDKDRLSYRILSGPQGMSMQKDAQSIEWRPSFKSAGSYNVILLVSDGVSEDKQEFTLLVKNKHRAPRVNNVPISSVHENQRYSFKVAASSMDNLALSFTLISAPAAMVIDKKSGLIQWQTNFEDAGNHSVEVNVTDERGQSTLLGYTLMVKNKNRAPQFISQPNVVGKLSTDYRYGFQGKDEDWNPLRYQLLSAPKGMVVHKSEQLIVWPKEHISAGSYTVSLKVTDGHAESIQTFNVTVPPGS